MYGISNGRHIFDLMWPLMVKGQGHLKIFEVKYLENGTR